MVIPVHNEAGNIRPLYDELADTLGGPLENYQPEVIWVEDGSTDGTTRLVDELAHTHTMVRAIHLSRSWGQSAALAAGFDMAQGDIVVPIDGDGQNDPADIPRLVDRLEEGFDCVSGNRVDREDPLRKTIPSKIQTRLAKFTGPDIDDFGCTLKAYRASALEEIDLRGETHRYLPAQLYDRGFSVTEIDVNHRPRRHGDSRYGVGRLVRGFVDLLFHWFWVRFSTRPMHLFGGGGLVLMAVGVAIGVLSLGQRFLLGQPLAPHTPRLILVTLLVSAGLQLLVFGALAELLAKLHYDDRTEYRIDRVIE